MDIKEITELLRQAGDASEAGRPYREALAAALRLPLNREIEKANLARTLFMVDVVPAGSQAMYPMDIEPGEAWVLPRIGSIVQHLVGLEEIHVPTFEVQSSREWKLQVARDGRINILQRAMRSLRNDFVKFENQAAWECIKGSPFRKATAATDGVLTKSALNAGFQKMQSVDGLNVDVVVVNAVKAGDIREWSSHDLDPITMREVWRNAGVGNIWGADIIIDNDLPDDKVWFFDTSQLGIMPIRLEFTTYDDPTAIRNFRQRVLALEEIGFAVTNPDAAVELTLTNKEED